MSVWLLLCCHTVRGACMCPGAAHAANRARVGVCAGDQILITPLRCSSLRSDTHHSTQILITPLRYSSLRSDTHHSAQIPLRYSSLRSDTHHSTQILITPLGVPLSCKSLCRPPYFIRDLYMFLHERVGVAAALPSRVPECPAEKGQLKSFLEQPHTSQPPPRVHPRIHSLANHRF
eukprot:11177-Chlamydomonas_euryale.AAC.1